MASRVFMTSVYVSGITEGTVEYLHGPSMVSRAHGPNAKELWQTELHRRVRQYHHGGEF